MTCKKIKNTLEEYHAGEGISRSSLFHISVSPQWFQYCRDTPTPPTNAMVFGSAFHKAVLEPDGFDGEFAVCPDVDLRTKDGKAVYGSFLEESAGKTVISRSEYEAIQGMRESVLANKYASALISGECEMSYYWADELTGVLCKARPDAVKRLKNTGVIADLKSCTRADTESFTKDCVRYGYDLQAAMYKEAVELESGIPHTFVFIAVEKTPPYMLNVMQADEMMIKRGQELFREYIGIYAECERTGNWYGYNGFSGMINNLSLPAWMLKEFE